MDIMGIALATYLAFGQPIPKAGNAEAIVRYGGIQAIHADGSVTLRLKETGRTETAEAGGRHIVISLKDEAYPFFVTRHVKTWNDCDAVETWVEVKHDEAKPVRLVKMDSFAAQLPGRHPKVKVMSLTGVWGREANLFESEAVEGQIVTLASRAGTRDAWESNAAMMVSLGDSTETEGEVLGVALEWTGTTSRSVRRVWGGATQVFAGVDNASGPYVLDPGKTLTLPKAILVHSTKGKGEVSRQYHRWARLHLMPHGTDLHPVLLNSWEGSYFTFTEKTLTDMMDGVKEMGGEMFVLDDGWFGWGKYARDEKNQDKVGLGDWAVNPEKLPHGLGWLCDQATSRGLKFGLWVEPEMVNTRSWLAEAHPEWLLREPKRELVLGRGGTQTVLDYTNPAVRDNIFGQLDKVYSTMPALAYVKWDSNQHISNPGSTYLDAEHQPNVWFDYTVGLYDLLAKLQAKRPGVMTQACSSGGGHMDFGFLRYADEFWTSDDTDPLRRVFIQWGASQFYPACAMACHVTASPNHQTKRETPLSYRFDVAMCGRMGFELHPKNLSSDELAYAKGRVAQYKRIRRTVQQGDLYRLASPYENPYASLMYVNADKSQAVFFVLGLDVENDVAKKIRLAGLDAAKTYLVRGEAKTGRELMEGGLAFALKGKYASEVVEITEK